MNLIIPITSPRAEIIASIPKYIVEFRAISINKIHEYILQRYGPYFPRQYSLTDSSMWLFPAYAVLIPSVSFWNRAKAKDSYSMPMIMSESLSSKVLYIMKSCTIDFGRQIASRRLTPAAGSSGSTLVFLIIDMFLNSELY